MEFTLALEFTFSSQHYLDICDPVLTFDRFMGEIELEKYLKNIPQHDTGRLRYDPVSMLKTVLFGFMANGYISLRELEDQCKINLRFMYLMDYQAPSYRTFGYFINQVLADSIEEIFQDINKKIFETEHVDLQHLYIDGSKFEANANKYSWVWKKATEKSRYRLFGKITTLFEEINEELSCTGMKLCINSEYAPEYLKEAAEQYAEVWQINEAMFVHGRGHRKTTQQRHYEKLKEYAAKLEEYVEKIKICGEDRNSYSKTDHSATFMRIKTDYMGNDQLLPAYNVQVGVADEYIAVVDVNQYRSDMDCFIPLMNKFYTTYGFYSKYPVADLEAFLRNLLLNEKNEFHNRNLHISGLLNEEKVDIGDSKVDIQDKKVDIGSVLSGKGGNFSVKTTVHIHRLFEKFGFDEVFGRSAVMELLELKGSGASKLLSNLVKADIIEPVSGHGKGKYKFMK